MAKVFPQAVTVSKGTLLDLMKPITVDGQWISIGEHTLSVGDKVLISFSDDDSQKLHEVTAVDRLSFSIEEPHQGQGFVFGRQVPDFHRVDYDAISMLTVSAVQQIIRQQNATNQELEAINLSLTQIRRFMCDEQPTRPFCRD